MYIFHHQVVFSCTGLKKNCTLSFLKILNFELNISLVEFSLRCIPTIFFVQMAYLIHAFSANYQDLSNHPFGYTVKAFCYTLQSKASQPLGWDATEMPRKPQGKTPLVKSMLKGLGERLKQPTRFLRREPQ